MLKLTCRRMSVANLTSVTSGECSRVLSRPNTDGSPLAPGDSFAPLI